VIKIAGLDYIITTCCNLKCKLCDHGSGVIKPEHFNLDDIKKDFAQIKKVLEIREIKILGGEPTTHPLLEEILMWAKELRIASQITLFTNGVIFKPEFLKNINCLKLSRYPGVNVNFSYIKEQCLKNNVLYQDYCTEIHRQTLSKVKCIDKEYLKWTIKQCYVRGTKECYTIKSGFLYKCSVAPNIPGYLIEFGISDNFENDRISIYSEDFDKSFFSYDNEDFQMNSCKYCLGSSGKKEPVQN
jgi:organic radical activating enzyme